MIIKLFYLITCFGLVLLTKADEPGQDYAASNIGFSQKFYGSSTTNNLENIVVSPFSVHTAAGMIYMGAAGKTAEQMVQGLNLASNDKTAVAKTFKEALDSEAKNPYVNVANRVFVSKRFSIKPDYANVVRSTFHAEAQNVDFSDKISAINTINNWIETETKGKIRDLITEDAVTSDTVVVLANAINFKGKWETAFKERDTREEKFHVSKDNAVMVKMMSQTGSFPFTVSDELKAFVLELPYQNSPLAMRIVLPIDENTFNEMERKIQTINLREFLSTPLEESSVAVTIPKFKIEYKVSLNDAFVKMGMDEMFSTTANLSEMTETDSLVNQVVHKAYIEVNEEGTEASAATAGTTLTKIGPIAFIANRPFFFFIKEENGKVYFMGRYVKPNGL